MMQDALFHETVLDSLRAIVEHAGGAKAVGCRLRTSKTPDEARRWLLDCLNPSRQERLDPDDLLHLLRIGREVGYHGAMAFIAQEAGYKCEPMEPQDEQAKLQREFVDGIKVLGKLADRLERLGVKVPSVRAA